MNKSIEVISLIYRSKTYLNFICDQFKQDLHDVPGYDVKFKIVANDPNESILSSLPNCGVPYSIYRDNSPNDFYLNRVYRCWNYAGKSSTADVVCFVNSDMAFSKGWLESLMSYYGKETVVTSRLVESGRMPSGTHGYGKNFGMHPNEFVQDEWAAHAESVKEYAAHPGGLYMPVVFGRELFDASGGYPEGNVYSAGIGRSDSKFLRSGDEYFFNSVLAAKFGMSHVTAFDSLVYHFQSGEMLFPGEE